MDANVVVQSLQIDAEEFVLNTGNGSELDYDYANNEGRISQEQIKTIKLVPGGAWASGTASQNNLQSIRSFGIKLPDEEDSVANTMHDANLTGFQGHTMSKTAKKKLHILK